MANPGDELLAKDEDLTAKSASCGELASQSDRANIDPAPPQSRVSASGSWGTPLLIAAVLLALGVLRSWWIPSLLLGLLLILGLHELGHYVVARLSGMKVSEFFLGFGPKIWSVQRGETEFGLKAVPAGAYVRIIGMTNLEDVAPGEETRTYRHQSYRKRLMTVCAGSAVHFLMAIAALTALFITIDGSPGINQPPWAVGFVVEPSTANRLGIALDDEIVAVNGTNVDNWEHFGSLVPELPAALVEVEIERAGQRLTLSGAIGARPSDVLGLGFGVAVEAVQSDSWRVAWVRPDSAAESFGLSEGDQIRSFGTSRDPSPAAFAEFLYERDGSPVEMVVERGGEDIVLSGDLKLQQADRFRGFFGVGPRWQDVTNVEAFGLALRDFVSMVKMSVSGMLEVFSPDSLAAFFAGGDPERPAPADRSRALAPDVVGQSADFQERPLSIIGVFRLFAASESARAVLLLFAGVNVFIGLFNMVPLLPLDGGHAAIATYEKLRELWSGERYRVDAAKLVPVTWVVVALLLAVGSWAMVLDIFAWSF